MAAFFANNVGKLDSIIRVILGALLLSNVFIGLQTPVGWIGLIPFVTGFIGTCPVYSLLGISTTTRAEKVGLKYKWQK
jgi:hypothetical protein